MAEMEDRWLSVDEIGKHLGVSNDTVYRWSHVDRNWKGPMAWRKESASAPAFVSKKDKSTWQLKALDGLRLLANP